MLSSEEKVVVLDLGIPQLSQNKIFDPREALKISHTILPICYLQELALKQGIVMMTPDVFFNLPKKPGNSLLISALYGKETPRLLAEGVKPLILTCQESPFIATGFYLNLKKYSSQFKYSIVFSGMKKHLSKNTVYKQMFFPEFFDPANSKPLPFAQKKYLTMISGNKRISNWKKNLLLKLFYGFGVREIYSLRQEIVNFFAETGKFDLYGTLWDRGGTTLLETENIKKVYRGKVFEKLPVLSQYKFTFCLENSVFPGYVTEKIFDAMFAGSVPIYLGAPDIENFIPEGAFIDMRKFKNFQELDAYLQRLDEAAYETYLNSIRAFLSSANYYKFSHQNFAEVILNMLNREFDAAGI